MKLSYSEKFEDIKFVLRYFDKTATFEKVESGIGLTIGDDIYDNLNDVLAAIYKNYEPEHSDKNIREAKRMRTSPEVKKAEISIVSLISFYNLYRSMLVDGVLKNKLFIDQMATLISSSIRVDSDFQLLDIQVGEIVGIEDAPGLDKLYSEDVMAKEKIKVLSGLREHVDKDFMLNNKFLFVTNMKPAKFKGLTSEGMILCTKDSEGKVEPVEISRDTTNGSRLELEGYETLIDDFVPTKVDMKKSSYDNALKSFKVMDHFLTFKGVKVICNGKYIQTKTTNGPIS